MYPNQINASRQLWLTTYLEEVETVCTLIEEAHISTINYSIKRSIVLKPILEVAIA